MNAKQELRDFLSHTQLFNGLEQQGFEQLVDTSTLVDYQTGDTIVHQNKQYRKLFVLFSGAIEIVSTSPDTGTNFTVASLTPGAYFGEKGFLDMGQAAASVVANESCTVLELSREAAIDIGIYQKLTENIAGLQAERLHGANLKQIESLQQVIDQQKEQNSFGRFYIATIVLFAISSFVPDYVGESPNFQTAMRWLFLFLILIPAVYAVRQSNVPWSVFGVTTDGWKRAMMEGLLIGALVLPLVVIGKIFIAPADEPIFTWATVNNYSGWQFFFYLITYVPHSAIQEFIARGVGQGSLQRFMPDSHFMRPILIASFLFAILHLHLSIGAALMTFAISVLFGYVYYRHKTLLGVIVLHIILGTGATALGLI